MNFSNSCLRLHSLCFVLNCYLNGPHLVYECACFCHETSIQSKANRFALLLFVNMCHHMLCQYVLLFLNICQWHLFLLEIYVDTTHVLLRHTNISSIIYVEWLRYYVSLKPREQKLKQFQNIRYMLTYTIFNMNDSGLFHAIPYWSIEIL